MTTNSQIITWAKEIGLECIGFTDTDLDEDGLRLRNWLKDELHQPLQWMGDHDDMRWTPTRLMPEVKSIISVRLHYLPEDMDIANALKAEEQAYLSRYALGRDYHKVFRKRLAKLAKKINQSFPGTVSRALVDSAPVLERAIARKAGHGWVGKNTMLIHPDGGSYFFIGEIYTSLELEPSQAIDEDQCGTCDACIKVCPTDAFVSPYNLEVSRCISYLTIENEGPIPVELREPMGNRVFGCDDCQAICPYNREPKLGEWEEFKPRYGLDSISLAELFAWDEDTFLARSEGSPLRRVGYENFLRNLAVGLGNAPQNEEILALLMEKLQTTDNEMLREHIEWAVTRQKNGKRRKRKLKRD